MRAESGLQAIWGGDRGQALQQLQHRPCSLTHTPRVTNIRGTPVQYCIQIRRGLHSEVVNTGRTPTMQQPYSNDRRTAANAPRSLRRSFEVVRPVHTAARDPSRTYKRETVTVTAGRSKIHTCRTDDTGLSVTQRHTAVTLCAAEYPSMGSSAPPSAARSWLTWHPARLARLSRLRTLRAACRPCSRGSARAGWRVAIRRPVVVG